MTADVFVDDTTAELAFAERCNPLWLLVVAGFLGFAGNL
jgi:hypothetical protein